MSHESDCSPLDFLCGNNGFVHCSDMLFVSKDLIGYSESIVKTKLHWVQTEKSNFGQPH